MARLILTTVGTSIITKENVKLWENYKDEIRFIKSGRMPRKYSECVRDVAKNLITIVKSFQPSFSSNDILSAELASLRAFKNTEKFNPDDLIVLLATATVDGKFCADVNKTVLDSLKWSETSCELCVVKGFKTKAIGNENIAEEFITEGLENLKKIVDNYYNTNVYDEGYFNITGGFKVIVPFATIIAFGKDMNLIYLYEGSNNRDLIIIKHPSNFHCTFEELRESTFELRGMPHIGHMNAN